MPVATPVPVAAPSIVVNVLAPSGATTSVTIRPSDAPRTGPLAPGESRATTSVPPSAPMASLWNDPGVMVPWVGSLVVLVGIVLLGRHAVRLRREVRAEIAALRARRTVPPSTPSH